MTSDLRTNTLRVALAGGGTGGHIIPALAIAEQLQRSISDISPFSAVECLFFGSDYGMETSMVPEAGFELVELPIRGLSRSLSLQGLKQNIKLPVRLISSIVKANKQLRLFAPNITVGTGGYASAIPVRQSLRNGIPVVLQEQNSYPGLVTRLFSTRAEQIFLTYEDANKHLKGGNTLITGNPVRQLGETIPKDQALALFGLDPRITTLFIMGGSQGARAINQHFIKKISLYLEKLDVQVLWQTGKADLELCQRHVGSNPRIKLMPFIKEMDSAYSAADLMICRAGAMSLTEINNYGLPAILIPLPSAAGNHQEHNARSQENAGAAKVVLESDLGEGAFLPLITKLISDREQMSKMAQASKSLSRPTATQDIVENIIRISTTSA